MEGANPYEQKYKQLSMLGKGNYGKAPLTQARFTRSGSTMARKVRKRVTSSPRRCFWRECPKRTSKLLTDKYRSSDSRLQYWRG